MFNTSTFPLFPVLPPPPKPVPIGCDTNDECPEYTACRNRLCINPCAKDDPCADGAFCRVDDHEPVCKCPEGYFGNPKEKCSELENKTNSQTMSISNNSPINKCSFVAAIYYYNERFCWIIFMLGKFVPAC